MIEKLRQLKKKSHMTNQQIAEKSNIPESTVARIFSGKTPNPTIATVIAMARAMGGSAAALLSEEDVENTEESTAGEREFVETYKVAAEGAYASAAYENTDPAARDPQLSGGAASRDKIYDDIINMYKAEIRKKDVWITRLFWCLAGIMAFILFVLIFDILHPTFGFVKYSSLYKWVLKNSI